MYKGTERQGEKGKEHSVDGKGVIACTDKPLYVYSAAYCYQDKADGRPQQEEGKPFLLQDIHSYGNTEANRRGNNGGRRR